MSVSKGRYVAKFCRPNKSYTGRPVPMSGRGVDTALWLVSIHRRHSQRTLIQVESRNIGVFADFEQAKAWAISRLNELVAQEQDNAGI